MVGNFIERKLSNNFGTLKDMLIDEASLLTSFEGLRYPEKEIISDHVSVQTREIWLLIDSLKKIYDYKNFNY